MVLESEMLGDGLWIRANVDRIDAAGAVEFKDRMRELTKDGVKRVVLDLQGVDFIDSSGLGAIVASLKQLAPGQVLELAGLGPTIEKVFRLTRMDTVFTIHPSADAAFGGT